MFCLIVSFCLTHNDDRSLMRPTRSYKYQRWRVGPSTPAERFLSSMMPSSLATRERWVSVSVVCRAVINYLLLLYYVFFCYRVYYNRKTQQCMHSLGNTPTCLSTLHYYYCCCSVCTGIFLPGRPKVWKHIYRMFSQVYTSIYIHPPTHPTNTHHHLLSSENRERKKSSLTERERETFCGSLSTFFYYLKRSTLFTTCCVHDVCRARDVCMWLNRILTGCCCGQNERS